MASSGNFCTLNPLSTKGPTLSQGNCRADSTFYWATYYGTIAMPTSGKWYAECKTPNIVGADASFPMGIQDAERLTYLGDKTSNGSHYIGMSTSTAGEGYSIYTHAGGTYSKKYHNNSHSDTALASASNNDIYQIAVDLDNNKLWFGKNNTWDQSNPSTNGTATYTITNKSYAMGGSASNSEYHIWNFGQDGSFGTGSGGGNADGNGFGDFAYAPPTGFLALCTANLPISEDIDPAETDDNYPAKQFNTILYTGNAGSNAITGLGFQPDFCYIKKRNSTGGAALVNSTVGGQKVVQSNNNDAEGSSSPFQTFDADGFTLDGTSSYLGNFNGSSDTYVAWCWKCAGSTTSTNNEGNITSTVQANTKAGFSIITYTGSGGTVSGANPTFGHGLESAPDFLIFKCRSDGSTNWIVWHSGLGGANKYLSLNGYAAAGTDTAWLSNTAPSSTLITTDNGGWGAVNGSSRTYVCYAWHNVSGMQHFGTYEGNGNADGPFCYTGFRPRMVILKDMDRGENWVMFDSERNTYNPIDKGLFPNDTAAESTGSGSGFDIDFLSNGFKLRASHDNMNGSSTYVYACWGDIPTRYGNTF